MSETQTPTLAAWILSRIAEREGRARLMHEGRCNTPATLTSVDTMGRPYETPCDCDEHVGRVLATCAAHRRIVEEHAPFWVSTSNDGLDWNYRGCGVCAEPEEWEPADGDWFPCPTLRALAAIWSDREDFDERWAL